MFAIGRDACTDKIGLDKVGVKSNPKNLKVYVDEKDRSNIPYVHAIGDIADGKLELTPVAIQVYGAPSTYILYCSGLISWGRRD